MRRFQVLRAACVMSSIATLLLALASSCRTPVGDDVLALRYEIWTVDSPLDAAHGFGKWIEEFFVPESGVCFNVVAEGGDAEAHAFFATLEERTGPHYGEPHPATPPIEVRVPREIAEQALELACVDREWRARQVEFGREWPQHVTLRSSAELNPQDE